MLTVTLISAMITFLLCRYALFESAIKTLGKQFSKVNTEIEKAGFWYALSLRISGTIPFFILNCLLAMSPLKLKSFAVSTFLGMVPIAAVLVNAGTRLGEVNELSDVLSLKIMLSLLFVALLPIIIRFSIAEKGSRY